MSSGNAVKNRFPAVAVFLFITPIAKAALSDITISVSVYSPPTRVLPPFLVVTPLTFLVRSYPIATLTTAAAVLFPTARLTPCNHNPGASVAVPVG